MAGARNILLLGSIPLDDAPAVMRLCGEILGPRLARYPDGETGARSKFVTFQAPILGAAEQFEIGALGPQEEWGPNGEFPPRIIKLKPGATGTPAFGRTGYGAAAISGYQTFVSLKTAGVIPAGARFQVGLPSPMGVLAVFMEPDGQALAEPAYSARLIEDLATICDSIPGDQLTIQFDIPEEIAVWEDYNTVHFADPKAGIIERLVALIDRVPEAVEVGLHLCYGDISHRHWKEPDTAVMVDLANTIVAAAGRRIDYVHMPVPVGWTEPARFAALGDLALGAGSEIYLGVIHVTDGVSGAAARIAAAATVLPEFGVATSCGLGRRDPAMIPDILRLHTASAALGR